MISRSQVKIDFKSIERIHLKIFFSRCNLSLCVTLKKKKNFFVNKSSLHHGKGGHGVVHFQTRQLFFALSRLCDTNDNNYRVSRNNQSQILRAPIVCRT